MPATPSLPPHKNIEFASPSGAGDSEWLDAYHYDNVLGSSFPPGLAARDLEERLLLASGIEPTSYEAALR